MLRFYFDILLINNHSLTSLSCNMQPRRSDTYAATTLSSMCSPAFCRAAQKKILTSQNKSLMQWKQWIIKCKSWNLFFSPTLCGILKKYYWFIILWLHHLRQQETTNKTEGKHQKLSSYLCQAALQVAALLLVLQRHFCFLRLQKHQCLLHKSNPHLWSVSGSLDCSPLINKKGPLD